jgi:hypothetical protein
MPRSIESQVAEMKVLFKRELQNRTLDGEQLAKIQALEAYCDFSIEPYDLNNIKEIEKRVTGYLRKFQR